MPLPLTEIEAYTRMWGWPVEDTQELLYYINVLEDTYFAWRRAQAKKASKRTGRRK